ncbi:reverse transcriptase domain-containing protein [Tanacetum coccineum]
MKQNGVTNDALRLYLFPYSLTHHATAWFDRLPKNFIHTFQEMALKFLSKYFPPSMVTKLRNDISNFRQLPDESLFEAGESSGSNTSSSSEIAALAKQMIEMRKDMLQMYRSNQQVNFVTSTRETCGGPHSYYECQAAGGYTQDVYATTGNCNSGGNTYQPQGNLLLNLLFHPPVPPTPREEVEKESETLMDEVHITSPTSTAHVPRPGIQPVSLPKPKEDPKPNPHQPKIPYPSRLDKIKLLDKNDAQVPEKVGDPKKFLILCILQDLEVITQDVIVRVDKFNFLADFVVVDFEADPRVPIILGRPFFRTAKALVDLSEEKLTLRVENEQVVFYTDKSSRNNLSDIQSVHCINVIDFSKDKPIVQVMDIHKKRQKQGQNRTKPSTGLKKAWKTEAEGVCILVGQPKLMG